MYRRGFSWVTFWPASSEPAWRPWWVGTPWASTSSRPYWTRTSWYCTTLSWPCRYALHDHHSFSDGSDTKRHQTPTNDFLENGVGGIWYALIHVFLMFVGRTLLLVSQIANVTFVIKFTRVHALLYASSILGIFACSCFPRSITVYIHPFNWFHFSRQWKNRTARLAITTGLSSSVLHAVNLHHLSEKLIIVESSHSLYETNTAGLYRSS